MFRLLWIQGCCIGALFVVSWRSPDLLPELSQEGRALALELGCGACHAGDLGPEVIRTRAPILGSTVRPVPAEYVFDYLVDPVRVRPDIGLSRMPSFDLTDGERAALALFLSEERISPGGGSSLGEAVAGLGPDVLGQGVALFQALNCAGCHEHEGFEGRVAAGDLAQLGARIQEDWFREYLPDPTPVRPTGDPPGSGSRMPGFRLTDAEVDALVDFLSAEGAETPDASAFDPPPPTPFATSKAEALLRHELPCLGCHRLGGDGGVISPPLDGVGQRLKPDAIRDMIEDPSVAKPGTMMPKSVLREDRVDLLAAYLVNEGSPWIGSERTLPMDTPAPEERQAPGQTASTADAAEKALYDRFCAHCHGTGGGGNGYNAPFLPVPPTAHADSATMSTRPDDTLFDGIYAGGRVLDRSHRMPAFGEALSREEIRSLVAYVRTLCRCQGPAWTRDPGG